MPEADSERARHVTRYSRSGGSICFELPLLGPLGWPPQHLVEVLLSSDLDWCWQREAEGVQRAPGPGLTHLTDSSASSLVDDLSERDEEGYGRFIALFGSPKGAPRLETSADLHEELLKLSADRDGRVALVVLQIGDTPNDYVHLRPDPPAAVARLLGHWGVREGVPLKTRKYRGLRLITLESIFGLDASRS